MHETTSAQFLTSWMRAHLPHIDTRLESLVPSSDTPPTSLHGAIRHSLFAGGKRMRPLLVVAAAQAVGNRNADAALDAGCAMEMIHTFSLIHDDLPALDNDDLRRGVPTCHVVFGEDIAILAGDALLVRAFEVLAEMPRVDGASVAKCVSWVAGACGAAGMVGGQVDDLAAEGRSLSGDDLLSIHERKTAALLRACVRCGGLLGGGAPGDLERLDTYAKQAGLAFQIVDDILDVTSDSATLGKPAGSDERHDKATYPKLYGLDASRSMALAAMEQAIDAVAGYGEDALPLIALARYMVERKS
jgi:geranylgeranyl diphosphate synthase type II